MSETKIHDTRIIIVSDQKSQTVNICTSKGQEGVYEWIIRFPANMPILEHLANAPSGTIRDLVIWMKTDLRGSIERIPPSEDVLLTVDRHEQADPKNDVGQSAIELAAERINALMCEFLQHPYLHRSEHNLHCEVYCHLRQHMAAHEARLRDGNTVSLIHKEWPEKPYQDRLGSFDLDALWPVSELAIGPTTTKQRGLYDIGVLDSAGVSACENAKRYRKGLVSPVAVIEFGLNEKYDHLRADAAKLINNKIRHGCLVHLARPDVPDNYAAVELLMEMIPQHSHILTAYARREHIGRDVQYHYKLTGSPRVIHADTLPQ
jgi:hypothetical protein